MIFIGAKRVAIDPAVCECKWAPEQMIGQDRTLEMIYGVQDWLIAGALLLAGLGMLAIPSLVALPASSPWPGAGSRSSSRSCSSWLSSGSSSRLTPCSS